MFKEAIKTALPVLTLIYVFQIFGTLAGFACDSPYSRQYIKSKSDLVNATFIPFYPLVKGWKDNYKKLENR
jgi:hypothetical protein